MISLPGLALVTGRSGIARSILLAFARSRESLPTALVAHGANPGLVSVLVKAALMALAGNVGLQLPEPEDRADWAALARALAASLAPSVSP